MIGLDAILVKTWNISNSENTTSERDRLQALSIGMEAYRMKIDLLTNATVVEKAVNFTDRNRGLIPQKKGIAMMTLQTLSRILDKYEAQLGYNSTQHFESLKGLPFYNRVTLSGESF